MQYKVGWSDPRKWTHEQLLLYWYFGIIPKGDD